MNFKELVSMVADQQNVKRDQADRILRQGFEEIKVGLASGQDIRTPIGTFSVGGRKARDGRDPRTGEPIRIAARRCATFRGGKSLKKAMNENIG